MASRDAGNSTGKVGAVHAEQTHRADGAAHQPAEDVAAALVRGRDAVREQHERRADVIGDDPESHVVLVVGAVALARELDRLVEHRAHLVGLVHVVDALLDEGDALEPHAGVDVLVRQLPDDAEVVLRAHVVDRVLHEDEVPDLDVPVVVGRGTAVDAVRGTAVEEDLGAGTCGARAGRCSSSWCPCRASGCAPRGGLRCASRARAPRRPPRRP